MISFNHQYEEYPFIIFSFSHFIMIGLFLCGIVFIYKCRISLGSFHTEIRYFLFTVLFVLELLYHIWLYTGGAWDIAFALPLHLCSVSLILCLVLLMTGSEKVFQMVYFIGVIGATMAIFTPELFLGFPHFRYYQFFITHMLIIWICLYYVFVKQYRPTIKGMLLSFIFLNVCSFLAMMVNKCTGGNYMFLSYKPVNGSILDYLGPYPIYIAALEVVALILFTLILVPFLIRRE
ncbi:TIGR02206 family membrane protein [Cytobacillus horneckiae]|uniref:YwaF family protein n=1 Tax=Cytobacillus horneckiae TaxID=549687 RepID=UPI0039A1950C